MTGHRVRDTLATKLVNELVKAADDMVLAKTIARYGRVDLLCIDELGYMELDRRGAELFFQVLTEREEKASVTPTAWPTAERKQTTMTSNDPSPRSGDDTFDLIDEALAALAERRGCWLGDDLNAVALIAGLVEQAERFLPQPDHDARVNGHTWREIARALGASPGSGAFG